jgi:hypothetical protein
MKGKDLDALCLEGAWRVVARSLPRRPCASGIPSPKRQGTQPQSGAKNALFTNRGTECVLGFFVNRGRLETIAFIPFGLRTQSL